MKNMKTIALCVIISAIALASSCNGVETTICDCVTKVTLADSVCTYELQRGNNRITVVDADGRTGMADSSGSYPCPPYCYVHIECE